MAYQIARVQMPLNDLGGHLLIETFLKLPYLVKYSKNLLTYVARSLCDS